MTEHDNTTEGIDRRYKIAVELLKPEIAVLCNEVGANVMVAALISQARDCARTAGLALCQYQMILIDELNLTNRLRRAMTEPHDHDGDA